jgi:hypothetical protein
LDGGGPAPSSAGFVVERSLRVSERAELIYTHRPLPELPGIIELAKALGAKAIWLQSGLSAAGNKVPNGCWLPDEDLLGTEALTSPCRHSSQIEKPRIPERGPEDAGFVELL